MNWLFPRLFSSTFATIVGGVLGLWFGSELQAPVLGTLLGSVVGIGVVVIVDTIRAYRLIRWLHSTQESASPQGTGFWEEIGYRAERSLRDRERTIALEKKRLAQLLSAIEASPNGILLLDKHDHIDWCNAVAADHFGLDPVHDRHQPVTNLIRAPMFVEYLQEAEFEQPVMVPDVRGRGTLSVLVRLYGDGLKLVLSLDVTERLRADAMRRDFVANVSHEIRTPLTALSGFLETMEHLPLTEPERKQILTHMSQQTQRMLTLVSDLLVLAQLEGSPRPPSDRWVLLRPLLEQVLADAIGLSAGQHELIFPDVGHAQLAGAEPELLSAVGNLVVNAVRYTPPGGRVIVEWSVRTDGTGEIRVLDNGIGIARDHWPRLTERFYRVDGSRSRDTGGTGLGLSIVKHVMQRHGGELAIESELGKGSIFSLIFPPGRVRSNVPEVDPELPMSTHEQS